MTTIEAVIITAAFPIVGFAGAAFGFKFGRQDGQSALAAAQAIAAAADKSSTAVLNAARATSTLDASAQQVAGSLHTQGERFELFADRIESLDSNVGLVLNTMVSMGALRRDAVVDTPARRRADPDAVPPPLDAGTIRPLDSVLGGAQR